LPLYLDLSLNSLKVSDDAQISLKESFLTFPMAIGSLLHGVIVPSGRIVIPDTPAAHPPDGKGSSSLSATEFLICDATGSPVTI
jgi:hypothetical protein